MKKETVPVRNSLLLLLTATIWGIAFVAQSVSMDYIGGFTFNSIRSLIGSLTLLPVILLLSKPKSAEEKNRPQTSSNQKILITGGICCGIILCLASNFQQFGIKYTTVGKAGFITACYIIIVPVIGIFLRKKCSPFIWIAVILVSVRSLSSLPDPGRGICYWQRRTSGSGLCFSFFHTYSGHRSFLASCRRCKNVLHPVFCLWNPFRYPGITS